MLANLQIWSKDSTEPEEKEEDHILVTRNHRDYRKVFLKDVNDSEALMQQIGTVFDVHLRNVDDAMLKRCGNGKQIMGVHLMAAVRKAAMAGNKLEVFFAPRDGVV